MYVEMYVEIFIHFSKHEQLNTAFKLYTYTAFIIKYTGSVDLVMRHHEIVISGKTKVSDMIRISGNHQTCVIIE